MVPAHAISLQVIKLISQVIADFANGEISQAQSLFDTEVTLPQYLDKSFYKTASLIAASCRWAAPSDSGRGWSFSYTHALCCGLWCENRCWGHGVCATTELTDAFNTSVMSVSADESWLTCMVNETKDRVRRDLASFFTSTTGCTAPCAARSIAE